MKATKKQYIIAISSFWGFGYQRISLLLSYFGDAKAVWEASSSDLIKVGLTSEPPRHADGGGALLEQRMRAIDQQGRQHRGQKGAL